MLKNMISRTNLIVTKSKLNLFTYYFTPSFLDISNYVNKTILWFLLFLKIYIK